MICDGKEFHVHRNILSVHSSVFRQMFISSDNEVKTSEVISGVLPKTFSTLLDFVYSGQLPPVVRLPDAFNLLLAAMKFDLKHLEKHCSKVILLFALRCPEKSLHIYQAAYDVKAPQSFMKIAFKIINKWVKLLICLKFCLNFSISVNILTKVSLKNALITRRKFRDWYTSSSWNATWITLRKDLKRSWKRWK